MLLWTFFGEKETAPLANMFLEEVPDSEGKRVWVSRIDKIEDLVDIMAIMRCDVTLSLYGSRLVLKDWDS